MGFAAGFRVGYDSAKDFKERRKKDKAARDVAALGADADVVQGKGLRVTNRETGESSSVVIDPEAGADWDTIRKQYEDAGYMTDTVDDAYTARSGQGRDYGFYTDANAAESGMRKANYGLTRGRANVYEQYGDAETARGLRKDAQQMRIQDAEEDRAVAAEGRAAALHGQQSRMNDLRISESQRAENTAQRMEMFNADAAQLEAQGVLKSLEDWQGLAAQHGLGPDEVFKVATAKMGMDEMRTKSETIARTKMFDAAARQGLGAVVELYDNHPLFDNGRKMTARQGKGGLELYDGDTLVLTAANERDALALMRTHLEDPVKATLLAYDIEKTRSGLAKDRAAIDASRASAQHSRAAAGQLSKPDYSLTMTDQDNKMWAFDKRDPNKRVMLGTPAGKPIGDEQLLEIQEIARSNASSVKGFTKMSPEAQQKLVDREQNRIMQSMRPQRGMAPGPGADPLGALDAELGAPPPRAAGLQQQRPLNSIDRITQSREKLNQINQLKDVAASLPENHPQRRAVVERINQLGMEYASIVNNK